MCSYRGVCSRGCRGVSANAVGFCRAAHVTGGGVADGIISRGQMQIKCSIVCHLCGDKRGILCKRTEIKMTDIKMNYNF